MTRHLTRASYTEMPWANGRGTTIEVLRKDSVAGLLWRFSMATVAEDGPFSKFLDIERNLTVIDGPGFDLFGGIGFRADPFRPVAFPGDIAVSARNVTGIAVDFNVMTRRNLPKPVVEVLQNTVITRRPGSTLCLFALGQSRYGPTDLARHDFLFAAKSDAISGSAVLAIHLFETPEPVESRHS